MTTAAKRFPYVVKVTDAEKRRYPSKHYVYVIQVSWNDGNKTTIFRRYSKFFDFQVGLLESFPLEGGLKDPSARIIPFLPGKILFRRSQIRDVAMKRLKSINEYCGALLQLPVHISQSEQVLDFFESKPEDLHPPKEEAYKRKRKDEQDITDISGPILFEKYRAIASYTRTQPKELSVVSGQILEVIEKDENGWWFVSDEEGERGWVPGVYLEKPDGTSENLITKQSEPGKGEKYITISQFNGGTDEVSFGAGVLVEVLQKNLEGWWFVSYKGNQGWAPASYLEKPAEVVLRQTSKVELIPPARDLHSNRRSLPAETMNAIAPSPNFNAPVKTLSTAGPRKHIQLTKTNSDVSKVSRPVCFTKPASPPVPPPPKKSSVKQRGPFVPKPQIPPPIPPTPSNESVYEYVTTSTFNSTIPNGISFKEDKNVKVLEKSPGDWWFIELGGEEGWAPASHIKKKFKQGKQNIPPSRPKPPKVMEPSQNSVTINKVTKLPQKNNSFALGGVKVPVTKNSEKRSLPPLPHVLHPKKAMEKKSDINNLQSKESVVKRTLASHSVVKPKIPETKNTKSLVTEKVPGSVDIFTKNDSKMSVSHSSKEITKAKIPPPRPMLRPSSAKDKVARKSENTKPKLSAVDTSFLRKQPSKPPPPSLKKPYVTKKSPAVERASVASSQHPVSIECRNVLKSTANQESSSLKSCKRTGSVPCKPTTLPDKPPIASKSALNTKKQTTVTSSSQSKLNHNNAVSIKTVLPVSNEQDLPTVKAKPKLGVKPPVLKKFQMNGNNSSSSKSIEKPNVVTVGMLQANHIAPNVPLPFILRGTPDGQVDDPKIEEESVKDRKSALQLLNIDVYKTDDAGKETYVAIANFTPEDDKEMGFPKGAEGVVLKKSQSAWWYMKIGNDYGWVPCNFFKRKLEERMLVSHTNNGRQYSTKEEMSTNSTLQQPYLDPLYSEVYGSHFQNEPSQQQDLHMATTGFVATDDTMVTITPGDVLEVTNRTVTGWWHVQIISSAVSDKGKQGWVPSEYVEKCK